MPKQGAPQKLTKKLSGQLVKAVSNGLTFRDAAAKCNISVSSITKWRKRGEEDGRGLFYDFFIAMARAQALRTERRIQAIEDAGLGKRPIIRIKREPVIWNGVLVLGDDGKPLMKESVTEDHVADWKALAFLLDREWEGKYRNQDSSSKTREAAEEINDFLREARALENATDEAVDAAQTA